jgi:uncharacterized small protein (DUF1192 family)
MSEAAESELAVLRVMLREALATIAALEAEIARLRALKA